MQPDYAVVIVNWNAGDLLRTCLRSLERATCPPALISVVDNGSSDGSDLLVEREFPEVQLLRPRRNLGFAAGCNLAISRLLEREHCPQAILLLNPDAEVRQQAPERLMQVLADDPAVGVVGGQLRYPDGSFQACAAPLPTLRRELLILTGLGRRLFGPWYPAFGPQQLTRRRDVGYVVGAALLARAEAIRAVGLLDEHFFIYGEEVDWCFRFRQAGWRVVYEPSAEIVHHVGASTRQAAVRMLAQLYRSRVIFFRKHRRAGSASALKALIWTMTVAKLARRALAPSAQGAPPVPVPMLHAALRDV